MSDMMQGGPAPQPGGAPKSMFNPTDAAMKAQQTGMNPQMTVGEFLQKAYGISPNDPLQKLAQVMKGQVGGATMPGKMAAMQGQAPGMGRPPQVGPGESGSPGIAGLMSGMKG